MTKVRSYGQLNRLTGISSIPAGANQLPLSFDKYTNRTVPGYVDVLGIGTSTAAVTVNGTGAYRRGEYLHAALAVDNSSAAQYPSIVIQAVAGANSASSTGSVFLAKAELLVRAQYDRCLEGSDRKLFEELAAARLAKRVPIPVPRQREHRAKPSVPGRPALPARMAKVEVRFKEVGLSPPQTTQTRHKQPIKLWAVYLREKYPPKGAAAVHWLLLTSIPVTSLKQALQCVRWYCRRWRIEEWHRVMKSGCKILHHQNHTGEVLLRAIALDAVIAWRIMLLALLGR